MALEIDPEIIGNFYLIFATVERKTWKKGLEQQLPIEEIRVASSDFKSYEELRMTAGGWFREDQEPPVMTPPASLEWVKSKR